MRKMGSSAMAGIKFVREEDYKKLARDPAVLNARYRIILGRAGEEKLQKFNTEVSYATEEEAGSMYCAPTEAGCPQSGWRLPPANWYCRPWACHAG